MASYRERFLNLYFKIFRDLRVATPGYIVEYNPDTNRASIQPTIKLEEDGEYFISPQLHDVRIKRQRGQAGMFYLPPKVDDLVDIKFYDQSINEQQLTDGKTIVEPKLPTRHNQNSCYAELTGETRKSTDEIPDKNALCIVVHEGTKSYYGSPSIDVDIWHAMHKINTNFKTLCQKLKTTVDSPGDGSTGTLYKIHTDLDTIITDTDGLLTKLNQIKV